MRMYAFRVLLSLFVALAIPSPARAAVSSTASYQDYTGNGATTAFVFTFPATATSHVETLVGGVAQTSGVVVVLNGNQATSPGGTVTFSTAPAAGAAVRIQRTVPLTQDLVLQANRPFPSKSVEGALDKLAMQAQQLARRDAELSAVIGTGNPNANLAEVTATGTGVTKSAADWMRDVDRGCSANGPALHPRCYGATGDGVADDTAALQTTIDMATVLGKAVTLGYGTYRVTPTLHGRALTARPGVVLRGPGTVKLSDNAPKFDALILADAAQNADGFAVEGVTFDMNGAANVLGEPIVAGEYNTAVSIRGPAKHVRIEGNTFLASDSVNTVILNGGSVGGVYPVKHAKIIGNTFRVTGDTGHDHSTIYGVVEGLTVSGNHFIGEESAPGVPMKSATAAIETHAPGQVIADNYIEGFRDAMNITGVTYRSDGITVSGNTVVRCLRGIRMIGIAAQYGGSGAAQTTTVVSGNALYLDPNLAFVIGTFTYAYGVFMSVGTANDEVENLTISNNVIAYKPYTGASTSLLSQGSFGLGFSDPTAGLGTIHRNVKISGNTVHSPIACGVSIETGNVLDGLVVSDNLISDAGHASVAAVENRCGVSVTTQGGAGTVSHATIRGNRIYDSRSPGYTGRGILWMPGASSAHNVIADNDVTLTIAGVGREVSIFASTGGPYVRHRRMTGIQSPPTGAVALGSIWDEGTTGVRYMQSTSPSGTSWVSGALPGAVYLATPAAGSITPDAAAYSEFRYVLGTASGTWTLEAPSAGAVNGRAITVTLRNSSGGAVTINTGVGIKAAAVTAPANGFSRSITLRYDGTNWIEVSRTPADVPN